MKNEMVPLAIDNELRPRGTTGISTAKMLKPVLRESIDHIATSLTRLGEIADRACREDNPVAEAQIRSKLAEIATRFLSLQRSISEDKEPPLDFESIPDWSALPEKVRENFEEGIAEMKVRFGPDWWEHWNLGRLSETDEHITKE